MVISLNYDDVPEHSSELEFYDGYQTPDEFDLASVNGLDFDHHAHFQLHGSVLLGTREIGDELQLLPHYGCREEAAAQRSHPSSTSTADNHDVPSVPIVTGLRKTDKILREPFASYHSAFRTAALEADRWLIVGYGFMDPHINSVLRSVYVSRRCAGCCYRPRYLMG